MKGSNCNRGYSVRGQNRISVSKLLEECSTAAGTQGLKEGFKNRISVSKLLKECGTAAGTQEGLKNTNKQTLTGCGGVALLLFSHICFGSVAAARGACVVVTTATNQPDAASSKQPVTARRNAGWQRA